MTIKEQIAELERTMRDNAMGIKQAYDKIAILSPDYEYGRGSAATKALSGIIQYLQEPLDARSKKAELDQMWDMGLLAKVDYKKLLAEL